MAALGLVISLCLSFCCRFDVQVSRSIRQPWRPYHIICIQNLFPLVSTAVYVLCPLVAPRSFVSARLLRRDCACPVSHKQTSKSSSQTFKLDRTMRIPLSIQWEKSSASNHCPALGTVFERSFHPCSIGWLSKFKFTRCCESQSTGVIPVTLSSLATSSARRHHFLTSGVKKAPPAMAERRRSGVKKLKPGEQGSSDTEGTMSLYDRTPVVQTLGQRRVATRSPSWITRCAICHCHVWDAQI